ncbi:MAG: NmrA/HSCARG family protein [Cytophagaceae bacterium]|nr:NmrA/HSCARG family protein [Gemmatimonadaceae bacterium]
MSSNAQRIIAVIGATGQQGGSVVRAVQARGEFRVRALTRNPAAHEGLADEVAEADLDRPATLRAAFDGAYGVFVVTNFWEAGGDDEITQATAAIRAAKDAGVRHFVWSTLPNVEAISGGRFTVPHFTNKAAVDALVGAAAFEHYTFVIAPFFYQNLLGNMAPQKQRDGSIGWTLPIDPDVRGIHMGDITELGNIVAGAFAQPDLVGHGEYLPLVGDLLSFNDIVATLNNQGHDYAFNRVPASVFATFFPGAGELAEMFGYFEQHTYLGAPSEDRIASANRVAGKAATPFASWARTNMAATSRPELS